MLVKKRRARLFAWQDEPRRRALAIERGMHNGGATDRRSAICLLLHCQIPFTARTRQVKLQRRTWQWPIGSTIDWLKADKTLLWSIQRTKLIKTRQTNGPWRACYHCSTVPSGARTQAMPVAELLHIDTHPNQIVLFVGTGQNCTDTHFIFPWCILLFC